jgi:hypothetical protein
MKRYRQALLNGQITHRFRNGHSEVMGEIKSDTLWSLRKNIWRHQILRSRFLRRDLFSLGIKIKKRFKMA